MANSSIKILNQRFIYGVILSLLAASWFFSFGLEVAFAELLKVAPPLVTLVPRDLGNDELWYLGGTASVPKSEVVIFLQNAFGETFSFTTEANEKGEWFYAHNSFLKEGKYQSWAQMKVGDNLSPPGPEVSFEIAATAFRIGSLRLSYESLYLVLAIIMSLAFLGAFGSFIYHLWHYHKKNLQLRKEVLEAESEVRSGFSILRKDLKEELAFITRLRRGRPLTSGEQRREEKLLTDLDFVENHILKEISDIEPAV